MNIREAIVRELAGRLKSAGEEFCELSWTVEVYDSCGRVAYYDCRPPREDRSETAREARAIDDAVRAAARSARACARRAIRAMRAGDWSAAAELVLEAANLELEFGDSSAYRQVWQAIDNVARLQTMTSSGHKVKLYDRAGQATLEVTWGDVEQWCRDNVADTDVVDYILLAAQLFVDGEGGKLYDLFDKTGSRGGAVG